MFITLTYCSENVEKKIVYYFNICKMLYEMCTRSQHTLPPISTTIIKNRKSSTLPIEHNNQFRISPTFHSSIRTSIVDAHDSTPLQKIDDRRSKINPHTLAFPLFLFFPSPTVPRPPFGTNHSEQQQHTHGWCCTQNEIDAVLRESLHNGTREPQRKEEKRYPSQTFRFSIIFRFEQKKIHKKKVDNGFVESYWVGGWQYSAIDFDSHVDFDFDFDL